MAMDDLQGKIRKLRSPLVMELGLGVEALPPRLLAEEPTAAAAYGRLCLELLEGLKELVPAVRISFSGFALLGAEGMEQLGRVLAGARQTGYYTLLDAPELFSPAGAQRAAQAIFGEGSGFPCDGLVINGYLGSDVMKPFLPYCGDKGKDLFVLVRSGNRSASELQDLRTGTRLSHMVAADYTARYVGDTRGKYGYGRVGLMAAATSGDSLRALRSQYPGLFLLVEGYDYPGANAKNCAAAFDRMGYGAAVCSGLGITAGQGEDDYVELARGAAERMKRSIGRYVTVL